MTDYKVTTEMEKDQKGCDIKVWCASCRRSEYTQSGDKYLCSTCGKIMDLSHEMHHEPFPHMSGDEDNMS